MRRIRITGRFYVFVAMLLIGLFFIAREFMSLDTSEALVTVGTSPYTSTMSAVIVRDESVTSAEEGRIEYLVDEGEAVSVGDSIVDLYTASHIAKAFTELEGVRANIRAYYQRLRAGIKDSELERLESNVQAQAADIKRLIQNNQIGNMVNVERMLEQTMDERYSYINANRREESKLNNYYDQETRIESNINSWKTTRKAESNGVVSFYLDGYERDLTPQTMSDITMEQVHDILNGKSLRAKVPDSRIANDVFKITDTEKWYVILISGDTGWNPISGQIYQMQMEGVSNFAFLGTITEIQKNQGEVMALVEVDSSIGPLINHRSGKINVSTHLQGFTVPREALATKDGQTGVWINDPAGVTFVPVEVLKAESRYALVEPLVEGTMRIGQRVLLQ